MTNDDQILCSFVMKRCSENPELLRSIIDSATMGVKSFADSQKDSSSKMAFMVSQILTDIQANKFGPFQRKDLLDVIKPWLGGTKWFEDELKKCA